MTSCSCKLSPYSSPDFHEDKLHTSDSEPSWTASRCQRLLRPLSSKIALLRKIQLMGSKELCDPLPDSALGTDPETSSWARASDSSQEARNSPTDTRLNEVSDWTAYVRPRKKLRRTYSAKSSVEVPVTITTREPCRKRETTADAILRLIRHEKRTEGFDELRDGYGGLALQGLSDDEPDKFPCASTESLEWEVGCGQKTPLRGAFTKLARNLSPVNWRTLDGLCDGLAALLKATSDGGTTAHCGCKSNEKKPPEPRLDLMLGRRGCPKRPKGDNICPKRNTKSSPCPRQPREKSLFATCLRKVPTCIIDQQRTIKLQDPENEFDASTTMYDELEQMSTASIGGWKPLKEIVRAHGIALLVDAIKESLINLPIARALMVLCLEQGAYDEAGTIVEAMTTMMKPLRKPETLDSLLFSYRTSVTLQSMHTISLKTKQFKSQYVQLARLFETSIIPIEWVSTPDMVDIWNRAMISATQAKSDAAEAAMLVRSVFARGHSKIDLPLSENIHSLRVRARSKRRAAHNRKNTLSPRAVQDGSGSECDDDEGDHLAQGTTDALASLLTVLTAITMLGLSKSCLLMEIGHVAQQVRELRLSEQRQGYSCDMILDRLGLCMLASFIAISGIGFQCSDTLAHCLEGSAPSFQVTASSFMCNLAEYCGRLTLKDPFEHLQDMIKRLSSKIIGIPRKEALRVAYDAVCVSAAFNVAEKSGLPRHLEGALTLEQKLRGGNVEHAIRTPGKTPLQSREYSRSGFRWEEGICEWVAQTPAVALKVREAYSNEDVGAKGGKPENNVVSSSDSSLSISMNSFQVSPCVKKQRTEEALGQVTEEPESSMRKLGSLQSLGNRGRGRRKQVPCDIEWNDPSRLPNDNQTVSRTVEDVNEPLSTTSPHELLQTNPKELLGSPTTCRFGPIVLIEKVKLCMSDCAEGTSNAKSRATDAVFTMGAESEDELSIL